VNGAAQEFRRIAEDYCTLVEEAPQRDRLKLHEALLEILPTLYASGSALPLAEPESEELLPDQPTNEKWFAIRQGLDGVLGPSDHYRYVEPSPAKRRGKPILGSVAGDLADIWKDLKQGLLARESGFPEADVVWHWRLEYVSHWGHHAVNALAAVHEYYW
jgi:Domain of unknown function (DUF5063)